MDKERLERLLAPITSGGGAGEDLAYSALFDEIREARREDDPALAQGEWAAAPKRADWSAVRRLCEEALCQRSKDLQLAGWYAESLVRLDGFDGIAFGLQLITGLLERFWESGYPVLDGDDASERAARLEWIAGQLGREIRLVALTAPAHGGYDWYRYDESRDVENRALRDAAERDRAIAQGGLTGEQFDRSARASGDEWFGALKQKLTDARFCSRELARSIDMRFAAVAPSLAPIDDALDACIEVCDRQLAHSGATAPSRRPAPVASSTAFAEARRPVLCPSPAESTTPEGPIRSRNDAIRHLRAAAEYFRSNEPHSPVPWLVERAAGWAEMPFEEWLQAVIKDGSTLGQLEELLGIRRS